MTLCQIIEKSDTERIIKESMDILRRLRYPHGLFPASKHDSKTGYNNIWLRDNFYTTLAFKSTGDMETVKGVYHSILDILIAHEWKIDEAIKTKPNFHYQHIHPRYSPHKRELWDEWGNKQYDAIGCILFKICQLEHAGEKVVRNKNDLRILQKLVNYLNSIEYWHSTDHGMWEYLEEIHSSSVGACVAGLDQAKNILNVPSYLISNGEQALAKLLPMESASRRTDLAQLSLIFPYNILDTNLALQILQNVEERLVKEKGVIRHAGDPYYNHGSEAQWVMGFPWLSLCYNHLGLQDKAKTYQQKAITVLPDSLEVPELYHAEGKTNENTPLLWGQALLVASLINLK